MPTDIALETPPALKKTQRIIDLLHGGNHPEALHAARQLSEDDLLEISELIELAQLLSKYGYAAEGARVLEKRCRDENADGMLLLNRSHLQWMGGDTLGALKSIHSVLVRFPCTSAAWRIYAVIQYSAGNYLEAFMGYSTAASLEKDNQRSLSSREVSLRMLLGKRDVTATEGNVSARFILSGRSIAVDMPHMYGKFYEAKELAAIAEIVPRGGTVVDVGGNLGNHAAFFLKALVPRKLHVFEPNPVCVEILRENLMLNVQPGTILELHEVGVGAESGELFLNEHDDLNNNLSALASGLSSRRVPIVTLDSTIEKADFVKIDVEGMELDVLAGAKELIRRSRPILFVEVQMKNAAKFSDFVVLNNYKILRSFAGDDYTNVIAVPKD